MSNRRRIHGGPGHNGGPSLDDRPHVPPWGKGGIGAYFAWKAAHRAAWKTKSRDLMLFRLQKAEAAGVSYEKYTLELLERGRHLQPGDTGIVHAKPRGASGGK